MKRKLFIVGIAMLLIMPNLIANTEITEGQETTLTQIEVCHPAPLGISYGRTSGWKHSFCESKTIQLYPGWSILTTKEYLKRYGGLNGERSS